MIDFCVKTFIKILLWRIKVTSDEILRDYRKGVVAKGGQKGFMDYEKHIVKYLRPSWHPCKLKNRFSKKAFWIVQTSVGKHFCPWVS